MALYGSLHMIWVLHLFQNLCFEALHNINVLLAYRVILAIRSAGYALLDLDKQLLTSRLHVCLAVVAHSRPILELLRRGCRRSEALWDVDFWGWARVSRVDGDSELTESSLLENIPAEK